MRLSNSPRCRLATMAWLCLCWLWPGLVRGQSENWAAPETVFAPAGKLAEPDWINSAEPLSAGPAEYSHHLEGKARAYFINDQRIEFTGQEATFAAEGVVAGGVCQQAGNWELQFETELFINQPFDRNLLTDTPDRRSFAANFDIDPLLISQLYLAARREDLSVALGRFVTPFGRFYFTNYRNSFDDSPFIRTEAILFRETGLLLQWDPGLWTFSAALTNGGPEQDTNSSKALVARVGLGDEWLTCGSSVKIQDGIGSESQKSYNQHVGLDAMVRRGNWTLSGELIYDEYGLRRPGVQPRDIRWGRSLYFRDLNNGIRNPLTGVGYYLNLGYEGPFWSLALNYGEFYPRAIGVPAHDIVSRRGSIKASRHWTPQFETYIVTLLENDRDDRLDSHPRDGVYYVIGGQFVF
jgi:hypothetical protein